MSKQQPAYLFNDVTIIASSNYRFFLGAFSRVTFWVHAGTNPTGTNPTLDVKLQYRAPREGAAWTDVPSASITQITTSAAEDLFTVTGEALMGEEYLLVITIGGTDTPTYTNADILWVGQVGAF